MSCTTLLVDYQVEADSFEIDGRSWDPYPVQCAEGRVIVSAQAWQNWATNGGSPASNLYYPVLAKLSDTGLTDSADIYALSALSGGTFDPYQVSYRLVTAREVEL